MPPKGENILNQVQYTDDFPKPKTSQEATERILSLTDMIQAIQAQLSDEERLDGTGRALNIIEFQAWRRKAMGALRIKSAQLRLLKVTRSALLLAEGEARKAARLKEHEQRRADEADLPKAVLRFMAQDIQTGKIFDFIGRQPREILQHYFTLARETNETIEEETSCFVTNTN
jgi:hypothetical protein